MDSNDRHSTGQDGALSEEDSRDVAALRAERAEARRIARWLYDRSPALRLFIGDVSEWPWLIESHPPEGPTLQRLTEADRDLRVLRGFAVIQAVGEDPSWRRLPTRPPPRDCRSFVRRARSSRSRSVSPPSTNCLGRSSV